MLAEIFPKRRRSVQERLSDRRALIGLRQLRPNPSLLQMAAKVGYDFLFLDGEHGEFDDADCQEAISVLATTDLIAMVRLAGHDLDALCRYVNMGADVIIVPHVSTPEEARRLVRAMNDATVRSSYSGRTDSGAQRERPYLIAIIESALGVSHAEAILAVDGIDGVLVGPSDLSADLGSRGDYSHAMYSDALARVEQAAIAAGKILGTAPHSDYKLEKLLLRGHRVFVMGSDASLIEEAMRAKVSAAQSALETVPGRRGTQSNGRPDDVGTGDRTRAADHRCASSPVVRAGRKVEGNGGRGECDDAGARCDLSPLSALSVRRVPDRST
jgi:4-hydroxy-2-oxoheptanedioate aldolase